MPDELDIFAPNPETTNFADDVYKKWFKTKTQQGFLSIRTWLEAGKVSVDVGESSQDGLKNNTQVWANALELATFLRAVENNLGETFYPARGDARAETFVHYGGGKVDNKPISRILKIEHWSTIRGEGDNRTKTWDSSAFAWKCGHFEARESNSGAFIPDMSKPLSNNKIRVTRKEMAEIAYRLQLDIHRFTSTYDGDVFKALNGNNK